MIKQHTITQSVHKLLIRFAGILFFILVELGGVGAQSTATGAYPHAATVLPHTPLDTARTVTCIASTQTVGTDKNGRPVVKESDRGSIKAMRPGSIRIADLTNWPEVLRHGEFMPYDVFVSNGKQQYEADHSKTEYYPESAASLQAAGRPRRASAAD